MCILFNIIVVGLNNCHFDVVLIITKSMYGFVVAPEDDEAAAGDR